MNNLGLGIGDCSNWRFDAYSDYMNVAAKAINCVISACFNVYVVSVDQVFLPKWEILCDEDIVYYFLSEVWINWKCGSF